MSEIDMRSLLIVGGICVLVIAIVFLYSYLSKKRIGYYYAEQKKRNWIRIIIDMVFVLVLGVSLSLFIYELYYNELNQNEFITLLNIILAVNVPWFLCFVYRLIMNCFAKRISIASVLIAFGSNGLVNSILFEKVGFIFGCVFCGIGLIVGIKQVIVNAYKNPK